MCKAASGGLIPHPAQTGKALISIRRICLAASVALTGCSELDRERQAPVRGLTDAAISALSAQAVAREREAVGHAREARFLDGGRRVLVLDRYPPYLRVFTTRGDSLWSGGRKGGGPHELDGPQAIAARDSTVYVIQATKLSEWRLAADTLAFIASWRVPAEYFPAGAEIGCDGTLLLYARNDRQFNPSGQVAPAGAGVDYLHSAAFEADSVSIRPLWSAPRDPQAFATLGHNGVLINRNDSSIAVLHRGNYTEPGHIIEFDCEARIRWSMSERPLIIGDSFPVRLPRSRALEWTGGIVAAPTGIFVPIHRFMGPAEPQWKTEVFRFVRGRFSGSAVITGQWTFMDHERGYGVLMTTNDVPPHFIVVPDTLLGWDGARQ